MSPLLVTGQGMVVKLITRVTVLRLVAAGPRGEKGEKGDPGMDRTEKRWYGEGPPTLIIGSSPGDEYVDALTGTLYVLT